MNYDFLIIGQGIAGSTLALELLKRGKRILVIDRQDAGSSSRVAAGLITPITGKGLNPAWRQEEYLPTAEEFYRALEKDAGETFYHSSEVIRLFGSAAEREKWRGKGVKHHQWGEELDAGDDSVIKSEFGGIRMIGGAWLDAQKFNIVVKKRLIEKGAFCEVDFQESEIEFPSEGVKWRDMTAGKVILCQGAYGLGRGGWFGNIAHRSAKGEILTLKVDGVPDDVRYHAKSWLAARGEGICKAGATYDWENLNSEPTVNGRAEVLDKLTQWCDLPIEVIDHQAGVRPIIRNSRPVVGLHPENDCIGFFNGLGSKGALMAPAVASHFAAFLVGESELDPELAIPFPELKNTEVMVTNNLLKQAHTLVEEVVKQGDVVIDATVGNGHDTLFLASLVGKEGKVIGFDVQELAIESTRRKVSDSVDQRESVILHHASHATMAECVDTEWRGKVACIMFNLGYLPGADKALITQVDSTLEALSQSLGLLRSGGFLSVMCYPGHAGGGEESAAVSDWFKVLSEGKYRVQRYEREGARATTPFLWAVSKLV